MFRKPSDGREIQVVDSDLDMLFEYARSHGYWHGKAAYTKNKIHKKEYMALSVESFEKGLKVWDRLQERLMCVMPGTATPAQRGSEEVPGE